MDPFSAFDTVTLLHALDQTLPTRAFLRDTFFGGPRRTFPTENVQVEFYVGTRRLAPFVNRYQYGRILLDDGFTSQTFAPPRFGPTRVIRADDLLQRGFGEVVGSTRSPSERAAQIMARYLNDEELSITRREEWLCAQLMLAGKIEIEGDDGALFIVNYGYEHAPINIDWSGANADPMGDLQAMADFIATNTGMNADVAIMDGFAARTFLGNAKVQAIMNLRHYIAGAIEPAHEGPGVSFLGQLTMPAVELYSYANQYVESIVGPDGKFKDVTKPYLPPGTIIVGSTDPQGSMAYGAILQFENNNAAVTYEAARVPFTWVDKDNQLRKVRTSSRPLPVPSNMQGWGSFNILGHGTTPPEDSAWAKFLAERAEPGAAALPKRPDFLGSEGLKAGGTTPEPQAGEHRGGEHRGGGSRRPPSST